MFDNQKVQVYFKTRETIVGVVIWLVSHILFIFLDVHLACVERTNPKCQVSGELLPRKWQFHDWCDTTKDQRSQVDNPVPLWQLIFSVGPLFPTNTIMWENNNKPFIWERFVPPIDGEIGDGLLLFYPHYSKFQFQHQFFVRHHSSDRAMEYQAGNPAASHRERSCSRYSCIFTVLWWSWRSSRVGSNRPHNSNIDFKESQRSSIKEKTPNICKNACLVQTMAIKNEG